MRSMQKRGRGGILAASKSCRKETNDAEKRQRRDNGCEEHASRLWRGDRRRIRIGCGEEVCK